MKYKFIFLSISIVVGIFSGAILLAHHQVYAQESQDLSGYAWSDQSGWISFSCKNSDVCDKSNYQVSVGDDDQLTGYAWSDQAGWISFSCKNSDVCDKSNYQVSVGDDDQLTGYAWSDQAGWISFSCKNSDVCDKSNYQVSVGDDDQLTGYAWSDQAGWISFSCKNSDVCDKSNYGVYIGTAPAISSCSDCGNGIFNICDREECLGYQKNCYFIDKLVGGDCLTCVDATCESYGDDEITCSTNPCGLGNCEWKDEACKSKYAVCFGNINNDLHVDIYDLAILVRGWGKPGNSDLNNDGITDIKDLRILTDNWGNTCNK